MHVILGCQNSTPADSNSYMCPTLLTKLAVWNSSNEPSLLCTTGTKQLQAAGVVAIAHRSGGPAADIVVPLPDGRVTGFLATTPEEYAEAMARVFDQEGVALTAATGKESDISSSSKGDEGGGQSVSNGKGGSGGAGKGRDGDSPVSLEQQLGEEDGGGEGEEAARRRGKGGEGAMISSRAVREAGRESARRFSNEVFDRAFAAEFVELLKHRRSAFRFVPRVRSRVAKED